MSRIASINHDRAFKELLTTFFMEFVAAMMPDVLPFIEPGSIEFLDKELFTDITEGEEHEADLIVKARFRGRETFFIIHVENQATPQARFPRRMFVYFARLHEKFDMDIYPVVIFSYDKPKKQAPERYRMVFPNKTGLNFEYTVIQLNRMNWRDFIKTDNPAAAALMTKMNVAVQDRIKVRMECLRMMRTLKLDPARSKLIGGFMDAYLKLTTAQTREYLREIAKLPTEEKENTMEMMSNWERRGHAIGLKIGLAEGITQGKEGLLLRQVRKRFGPASPQISEWIDRLSVEQLDELGESLFDFNESAELENWLKQRSEQEI